MPAVDIQQDDAAFYRIIRSLVFLATVHCYNIWLYDILTDRISESGNAVTTVRPFPP